MAVNISGADFKEGLRFQVELEDKVSPGVEKSKASLEKFAAEASSALASVGPLLDKQADAIVKGFGDVFQRMTEETRKASDEAARTAEETANRQKQSFLGVAAAVAGWNLAGRMRSAVVEWASAGDELDRLSKRTGIAVTELSALSYAAEMGDVPTEQLALSLRYLSRAMVTAQSGNGEAARAFRELGVSVTDTEGRLKKPQELFLETARAMNGVGSQAKLTATAMTLFGRSGDALLPLIQNVDELQSRMREAGEYGFLKDEETVAAAARMDDALKQTNIAFRELKGAAAGAAAEALLPFVGAARSVMSSMLGMGEGARTVAGGVGAMVTAMAGIAAVIILVNRLKDAFSGLDMTWKGNLGRMVSWSAGIAALGAVLGYLQREADQAAESAREVLAANTWEPGIRYLREAVAETDSLSEELRRLSTAMDLTGEEQSRLKQLQEEALVTLEKFPGLLAQVKNGYLDISAALRQSSRLQEENARLNMDRANASLANLRNQMKTLPTSAPTNGAIYDLASMEAAIKGPVQQKYGMINRMTLEAQIKATEQAAAAFKQIYDQQRSKSLRLVAEDREILNGAIRESYSERERITQDHQARMKRIREAGASLGDAALLQKAVDAENARYKEALARAGRGAGGGGAGRAPELDRTILDATRQLLDETGRRYLEYQKTLEAIDKAEGESWQRKEQAKAAVTTAFLAKREEEMKSSADRTKKMEDDMRAAAEKSARAQWDEQEKLAATRHQALAQAVIDFNQYRDQVVQATETQTQRIEREYREQAEKWKALLDDNLIGWEFYLAALALAEQDRNRKSEAAAREHERRMRTIRMEQAAQKIASGGGTSEEKSNLTEMLRLLDQVQMKQEQISAAAAARDLFGIQESAAELGLLLAQLEKLSTMPGPERLKDSLGEIIADLKQMVVLAGEFMAALASGNVAALAASMGKLTANMKKTEKGVTDLGQAATIPTKPMLKLRDVGLFMSDSLANALGSAAQAALESGKNFAQAIHESMKAVAFQEAVLAIVEMAKYFACLFLSPNEAAAHLQSSILHAAAAAMAGGIAAATSGAAGGGGGGGEKQKTGPRDYTDEDLARIKAQGGGKGGDSSGKAGGEGAAAAGGAGKAQPMVVNLHYNATVNAWDSQDAARAMKRQGATMAKVITQELVKHPGMAGKLGALANKNVL